MYFNHRVGCQKCHVTGVFDKDAHRIYFAEFNANMRTDNTFRNRLQPNHHKIKSLLEDLEKPDGSPLINMITQFPTSDPLHLLEEGVMKRSINLWMKGKGEYKRKKWSKETIDGLSKQILQWNRELPSDIHRKLRTLQYLSFYKATEFRTILLYLGIVAFKNVLVEEEYAHFLTLSLAIRLFSCNFYVQNENLKKIARMLIMEYCENFVKIYGKSEIVSNVHNLCHVADDVENFGNLNEISTYPFENFLHDIKLRVKPSSNSMEQISRRLIEQSLDKQNCQQINFVTKKFENASWTPELKYEFKEVNTSLSVYKFIRVTPNVFFSIKKFGDKWLLTKTGDIVEMIYAIKKKNLYFIYGAPICNKTDFFFKPYLSRKTDIYLSDLEKDQAKFYRDNDIKCKMMCLSYFEKYVFIPLLHSFDECSNI